MMDHEADLAQIVDDIEKVESVLDNFNRDRAIKYIDEFRRKNIEVALVEDAVTPMPCRPFTDDELISKIEKYRAALILKGIRKGMQQ